MTDYLLTRGQCFRVMTRKRRTLKGRSLGTIQRTLIEFSCLCRSGVQDCQSFDGVVLSDWGHFSDKERNHKRITLTLIETMIDDQLGVDRYWRRRSGNRTMGNLCRQQG